MSEVKNVQYHIIHRSVVGIRLKYLICCFAVVGETTSAVRRRCLALNIDGDRSQPDRYRLLNVFDVIISREILENGRIFVLI